MKNFMKISVLMMALFVGMSVNAQENNLSFGAKIGFNLSNYGGDVDNMDAKAGFSAGLTVDYGLSNNLFVLTGLDVTLKGAKSTERYDSYKIKATVNPLYLQLPVHLGYKLAVADNSRLVFSAGPYLALGLGGKTKIKVNGETEKGDFFGDEDDGGSKRFDLGVGLAVGYEFNRYRVSIGYDFGLLSIDHDSDYKVRNQNAFLTVGYLF